MTEKKKYLEQALSWTGCSPGCMWLVGHRLGTLHFNFVKFYLLQHSSSFRGKRSQEQENELD